MTKLMKWSKKVLLMVLTTIVAFSSMFNVNAAADTIQLIGAKPTGTYIGGVTFSYKQTAEADYYYCLNIHKTTAQNVKATKVTSGSVIDGGITYILKNGYPYKSITGNTDKDFYITQTAIWWYLDETTGSVNLGKQFKENGSDAYNMRHYVKELVQAGLAHRNDSTSIASTELTIGTTSSKMTLSGSDYISSDIKATAISNMSSYSVTLTGAPSSTKIVKGGTEFAYTGAFTVNASESFKIKVPASAIKEVQSSITVKATGKGATQYKAYEYKPSNSDMQNIAILEPINVTKNSSITLDIDSSKVTVIKIDSKTKQPLAGATLVVKDSTGKKVATWTSTVNGHVIRNLANGTYTVEETAAPKGYKLNTTPVSFTISDSKRDVTVKFENTPEKVVVTISKIDQETRSPLAGATMVIKDSTGKEVKRFVSTTEAYVLTDLAYGTYSLSEESAPAGYMTSDRVVTFTIDADHLSHQLVFENVKETPVPDTASTSSILMIILGLIITGTALSLINKNAKESK